MFEAFNILLIVLFIGSTIWSVNDSKKQFLYQHRFSQLLFNFSAGLLVGWFFIVGTIYCIADIFHLIDFSIHDVL